MILGYKKISEKAIDPIYSTEGSSCFDLFVCLPTRYSKFETDMIPSVTVFDSFNEKDTRHIFQRPCFEDPQNMRSAVNLYPGDRALIPTGIIFDIPVGYSLRIHPRSSTGLKKGLVLANGEGIVDWDYTQECFLLLMNNTKRDVLIYHGERLCQGELVPDLRAELIPVNSVEQKTSRVGGFGSTGRGIL